MKSILAVSALLLSFNFAHAGDANPWQHCGIGAMVFSKTPVGAAILNVTWDLGTTAVSSKISSEHSSCAGDTSNLAALFMHDSYANLEEESIKGEGQHVSAMLDIYQCEESAKANIQSDIQNTFATEVSDAAYTSKTKLEKVKSYFNNVDGLIKNKYAASCGA